MTTDWPVEGSYRCADCGTWEHLMAYAPAVAYGPVGADGDLRYYDDVDDDEVFQGSIQCTRHVDSVIEKFTRGEWHRWWACPECHGTGRIMDTSTPYSSQTWACHYGLKEYPQGVRWSGGGVHECWRPARELVAA